MQSTTAGSPAAVLLGPTASGKTPLGKLIAKRGLWVRSCVHFDFGSNLRQIVHRNLPDDFIGPEDIGFLRQVLESGALLEDDRFPLAERILRRFLARTGADAKTLVVLNGLPRHVGQAEAIRSILDVDLVIHLRCSSETVLERIRSNIAGDRTGRQDDDLDAIRNKLELFSRRTAPLLDYYAKLGARIETVEVTAAMSPQQTWQNLDCRGRSWPSERAPS